MIPIGIPDLYARNSIFTNHPESFGEFTMHRRNIDSVATRSNYEMEDERRTIGGGVDSTGRMDNYVFRESNESHTSEEL
ncbi:hypothetical protein V1478_016547 [Vespula squamosa]|uniref:Uncharacterized protein n=1 Tax=Vespula squamosa TaxID=30214 RepID=A0ABD2A2S2_VESSQ